MEFYKLLYDSSFIAFETLLVIIFAKNSLTSRVRTITIYLILLTLQIARRLMFGGLGSVSLLFSMAVDVSVIAALYSGKLRKKVFLIVMFYALSFIFDSTAILLLNFIISMIGQTHYDINNLLLPATILSKVMTLTAIFLIKDTLKTGNNLTEWLKYLPTPIFTIMALVWGSPFTNDVENGNIAGLLVVICVFSLLSNIFLIVSIHRTNEKFQLEYRMRILEESKRQSKAHFLELRGAYSQIDRIAHDIKHHLSYLEGVSSLESVRSYIRELKGRSFAEILRFTGNFDIDIILNAKNNEMRSKEIKLQVNNVLPPKIEWLDPVDTSIILGNSLTNAIESCERCNGKEITLVFKHTDNWLLISIENPITDYPLQKRNGFGLISTKKEACHGIGMESMSASVERYGGMMKYGIYDEVFRLDILLQKST